jgi:hypothetical protein
MLPRSNVSQLASCRYRFGLSQYLFDVFVSVIALFVSVAALVRSSARASPENVRTIGHREPLPEENALVHHSNQVTFEHDVQLRFKIMAAWTSLESSLTLLLASTFIAESPQWNQDVPSSVLLIAFLTMSAMYLICQIRPTCG